MIGIAASRQRISAILQAAAPARRGLVDARRIEAMRLRHITVFHAIMQVGTL